MCKPQEISNWLRSVYRISAGKWIPGRNKKPPLFCRFLRNWRYLNKNKNRRSSWGFCKSLKIFFTCRFCFFLSSLMWPSSPSFLLLSSLCFSTTLLALHPLFLVFTACESQCKIFKLVISDGEWKRRDFLCSLFTHPNGHVSLTWPVVYVFFFLVIVQFRSLTQKKVR